MAPQEKALPTKPDNLHLTPGNRMLGEPTLSSSFSDLHTAIAHAHPNANTHTIKYITD